MSIKENILKYWKHFVTSKSTTGLCLCNEPSMPDEKFYKRLAKASCREKIELIDQKQQDIEYLHAKEYADKIKNLCKCTKVIGSEEQNFFFFFNAIRKQTRPLDVEGVFIIERKEEHKDGHTLSFQLYSNILDDKVSFHQQQIFMCRFFEAYCIILNNFEPLTPAKRNEFRIKFNGPFIPDKSRFNLFDESMTYNAAIRNGEYDLGSKNFAVTEYNVSIYGGSKFMVKELFQFRQEYSFI